VSGQKELKEERVDRGFSLTSEALTKTKKEGQAEAPLMTLKRTKWGVEGEVPPKTLARLQLASYTGVK
jgi:hypothetical protein